MKPEIPKLSRVTEVLSFYLITPHSPLVQLKKSSLLVEVKVRVIRKRVRKHSEEVELFLPLGRTSRGRDTHN